MLTLMRQLLRSKIFGTVVFGFIIIGMAAWGVEDIFSGGLGNNVIKAGERGISVQQLDERFESYLSSVRRETQQPLTREDALSQGILDQIIANEAGRLTLLGFARTLRADASNRAMTREVQENFDGFKDPNTGKFSLDFYRLALAQNNISLAAFEQDVRDGLTLTYLREGSEAAISTPATLSRLQAVFEHENRKISWFAIDKDKLPPLDEPTPDEVRAFYESDLQQFQEPERRSISIAALTPEDFVPQVDISEAEIEETYEATKATLFAEPEERRFVESFFDSEANAQAAFGTLAGGADVATLPGFIARNERTTNRAGILDESLARALFNPAALTSAVFGPYPSAGQWMMVRLEEILPGQPRPLDADIREAIRKDLALREAEGLFYEAAAQLDDLIGEGLNAAEMAERLGLIAKVYGPIDQRGIDENGVVQPDVFEYRQGLDQAFNELFEGETSDRFDVQDLSYLITVDQVKSAFTPEFEEIADQVQEALTLQRLENALTASGDAAKMRLEAGTNDITREAERFGAELQRPINGITRTNTDVGLSRAAILAAFRANEGDIITAPGDSPDTLIVLQVETITPPSEEDLPSLASATSGQVISQLTSDIAFALERDIGSHMTLRQDAGALSSYRASITSGQ